MARHLVRLALAGAIMGTPFSPPTAEGVISKPSRYSVSGTVRRLDEVRAEQRSHRLRPHRPRQRGARGGARDAGRTGAPCFGNPRAGTPLMVARPLVGLDLPLRVLVWRDAEGQVWASYQDAAFIARRYGLPEGSEKAIAAVPALLDAALR